MEKNILHGSETIGSQCAFQLLEYSNNRYFWLPHTSADTDNSAKKYKINWKVEGFLRINRELVGEKDPLFDMSQGWWICIAIMKREWSGNIFLMAKFKDDLGINNEK